MKKNKLLIFFALGASFLTIYQVKKYYALSRFQSSDERILSFDPYKYERIDRSTTAYFYSGLPRIVQIALQNKKMTVEHLASCEADLVPGLFPESALGFYDEKIAHLFVFELSDEDRLKKTYDLSKMIDFPKKSDAETIQVHCLRAAGVLNSDQDILLVKASSAALYQIFAFDTQDQQFHLFGTSATAHVSFDQKAQPSSNDTIPSLPTFVQSEIPSEGRNQKAVSTCQISLIPQIDSYAVAYFAGEKPLLKVFSAKAGQRKESMDLSDLVSIRKASQDDYLEMRCLHASFLLDSPLFELKTSERELTETFQKSNHQVIAIKSRQTDTYELLAFSSKDQKFHLLGSIPAR